MVVNSESVPDKVFILIRLELVVWPFWLLKVGSAWTHTKPYSPLEIRYSKAFFAWAFLKIRETFGPTKFSKFGFGMLTWEDFSRVVSLALILFWSDSSINEELKPLKLDQAQFRTQVNKLPEDSWGQKGIDDVKFEVVTNPEQDFMPINKIASGGELSRFLLAIKVVMSNIANSKLLIFDEVDSGVGGQTANAVGNRLKILGEKNQTIVITHSPQVAALGQNHYISPAPGGVHKSICA